MLHYYYRTDQGVGAERYKRPLLFLQGFFPRARFTLPAVRGKTSLNARDGGKGKELLFI